MTTDWSMKMGTTKNCKITVTKDGVPVNITGLQIVWCACAAYGGNDLITKSTLNDDEIEITNGPAGIFFVYLTPPDTGTILDDAPSGIILHESRTLSGDSNDIEEVVDSGEFEVTYSQTYGKMPT